MIKVKFVAHYKHWCPGQVVSFSKTRAVKLIMKGVASPIREKPDKKGR